MLITQGRLEVELVWNPKRWGFTRGRTEVGSDDMRPGFYFTVGPLRVEWYPKALETDNLNE